MKVGDLVRIIQGGTLVSPWIGKQGMVVDEYEHQQSTKPEWFTVMVAGDLRNFHQGYLELINESR